MRESNVPVLMPRPLRQLPPLDAVKGFVAVCRRMSITAAAADLCLTQSAVSRQVQALEDYFRTPLLVRKHRAIELTEDGRRLFELASPWLDEFAAFTDAVRHESRVQPVTITASIGVAGLWLLPRLSAFQARNPQIDVRMIASDKVLDLESEGIDLAIRYCSQAHAPAGAHKLFDEEIVAVAAPELARRAFASDDALLDQVLLEFDNPQRPWLQWHNWLRTMGLGERRAKSMLRFNHYDQVIQAALEGSGIALGRLALIGPMLNDGRLLAHPGARITDSGNAYWLVRSQPAAAGEREGVLLLRDWLLETATGT